MRTAALLAAILAIIVTGGVALMRIRSNRIYESVSTTAVQSLRVIRALEVAYVAEWGAWLGNARLSPIGTSSLVPGCGDYMATPEVRRERTFSRFSLLGFAPDHPDWFSYEIEGDDTIEQEGGFKAHAYADLDRDGELSIFTITDESTEVTHTGDKDEDGTWWTFSLL